MRRGAVVLAVVVVVAWAGQAEGVERGPAARETRMKNTDLKKVREKYLRQFKDGQCVPMEPSPTDPPLPTVPRAFMTQLEIMAEDNGTQRVIHGVEMYDAPSRRGVNDYDLKVGVWLTRPHLKRQEIHYNHDLDEALMIKTHDSCIITGQENCDAAKTCTAGKIKDLATELQEMIGIVDLGDGGEFLGAMGLMQFGPQFNYTYAMEEECRGARCQVFQTCLNKPDEGNISLLYSYYWTTPGWGVQDNNQSVPMVLDIVDLSTSGFTLHVEFFDFRREWMPALDELEVPVDVYCEGRISYISQPPPITYFYYKSEQVGGIDVPVPDGEGQTEIVHLRAMFPQEEWYDYNMRVSRTDYIPFFIVSANRRFENYTQRVLDFNQDLMYHVKPRINTCKISPINTNITWGDVEVGEDGDIHMTNPWNWDAVSEPMQYNGRHWERGMTADVWVGVRPNPTLGINETVVWYYASPFSGMIEGKDARPGPTIPTVDKVPVKFEKYLSFAEGLPHIVYHIYNFEGMIPFTHNHDVSLCYPSHQMRHFTFDLPHNAIEKSLFLRENLKYAILGALREAGSVSPTRINRLEIKKTEDAVQVTFTLLEKPSRVADVVGDEGENSMNAAASTIKNTIDQSQLIILVKYGNTPDEGRNVIITSMTAMPNTMVEVERGSGRPQGSEVQTGYSPGDMAGLGVGMVVLGGLTGYAAMYIYSTRGQ